MGLLIDGYNVLYTTGILRGGIGLGKLETARQALIRFVVSRLPAEELPRTTIVFDAKNAPFGVPREVNQLGITVRYAVDHDDADELIIELIRADSAPRRLTVVSSDHSVQRAARRRRASAVDSETWYVALLRSGRDRPADEPDVKPGLPLSPGEVQRWLQEFGLAVELPEPDPQQAGPPAPQLKPSEPQVEDLANPFPPGYGEDLLE